MYVFASSQTANQPWNKVEGILWNWSFNYLKKPITQSSRPSWNVKSKGNRQSVPSSRRTDYKRDFVINWINLCWNSRQIYRASSKINKSSRKWEIILFCSVLKLRAHLNRILNISLTSATIGLSNIKVCLTTNISILIHVNVRNTSKIANAI